MATANGTHVALLRGINVGGKNKLPMKELAALFEAAGCRAVRTYIQSGNVVFVAPPAAARRLPLQISTAIEKRYGYRVPVVLRTAEELQAVAAGNPFLRAGADPVTLHVAFLAGGPTATASAALDPRRSPPDEFVLKGRELYLKLPNGVSGSKLTNAYLDKTLGTISTLRNWRTVLELIAVSSAGKLD
jgi:uncharacterized protein (DUF1697 family)